MREQIPFIYKRLSTGNIRDLQPGGLHGYKSCGSCHVWLHRGGDADPCYAADCCRRIKGRCGKAFHGGSVRGERRWRVYPQEKRWFTVLGKGHRLQAHRLQLHRLQAGYNRPEGVRKRAQNRQKKSQFSQSGKEHVSGKHEP